MMLQPAQICLYARFDDLRTAVALKDIMEIARTTLTLVFVGHHESFDFGATHPWTQAVSAYDGQVESIAMPNSVVDANLQAIFTKLRNLAETF